MRQMDDVPDLELLALFDTLHRERHLTRAARRAGKSQPAMSRALGRMREVFGDPLFVRTPRGMVPTPRADALAEEARRVLASARALVRPERFEPAALERTFAVATTDLVEAHLLPAITAALGREAPRADLILRPMQPDTPDLLEAGRLDLVVAPQPSLPAGLVRQHLFDDDFLCAVRRDHPTIRKAPTLEAYAAHPHIQIAPRGAPGGPVDAALAARGLARRVVVRTPSFVAAPLLAARSDLILTAPARLLAPLAGPLGLRTFAPPLAVPGFRVFQAWHPRVQDDPVHRWFRALVAGAARALDPGGRRA